MRALPGPGEKKLRICKVADRGVRNKQVTGSQERKQRSKVGETEAGFRVP
jgi:hypothetical protein